MIPTVFKTSSGLLHENDIVVSLWEVMNGSRLSQLNWEEESLLLQRRYWRFFLLNVLYSYDSCDPSGNVHLPIYLFSSPRKHSAILYLRSRSSSRWARSSQIISLFSLPVSPPSNNIINFCVLSYSRVPFLYMSNLTLKFAVHVIFPLLLFTAVFFS